MLKVGGAPKELIVLLVNLQNEHVGGYHVDFVFSDNKNYKTCFIFK